MANSVTIPSAGAADTITLARVLRNAFLADFTRNNRGAHARLEVLGLDVGYQVETDNRPFDGIAADDNPDSPCGASGFFGHRFGVKRVFQTGVVDGEES